MAKTFASIATTCSLALMLLYGHRFDKRTLILLSMLFYGVFNGLSLISGPGQYWLFISTRTISSFVNSAFSVLLPVIMADFFTGAALGRALMLFAFMTMIGSLLSISLAAFFVTSSLPWQSSLAIGPFLSIIFLPVIFVLFRESSHRNRENARSFEITRCFELFSIRSYLLLVIVMSLGAFYLKAFMFWTPSFLLSAWNYSPQIYGDITFPTVITTKSTAELIGTLTGLPLLVGIAEKFHFGFCSFGGSTRSIPIVFAVSSVFASAAALGQLYSASHSYTTLLVSAFFNSFMGAPFISLGNQMLLTVCPSGERTSAMSMLGLVTSITTLPAEQIIGRISDAIRGNSEMLYDRFFALEIALFVNWAIFVVAGLFYSLLIVFYPSDELKAREDENEDNTEKTPLLN